VILHSLSELSGTGQDAVCYCLGEWHKPWLLKDVLVDERLFVELKAFSVFYEALLQRNLVWGESQNVRAALLALLKKGYECKELVVIDWNPYPTC
jgi:hypothetical protein